MVIAIYGTSPRRRCQWSRDWACAVTNCEAEIVDPDGRLVAKALGMYKLG
jgi:hypothetical protein